jgi:hypothetical protein
MKLGTIEDGYHNSNIVVNVFDCSRCGNDHTEVVFKAISKPLGDVTHFALCPCTGQPILVTVKACKV